MSENALTIMVLAIRVKLGGEDEVKKGRKDLFG